MTGLLILYQFVRADFLERIRRYSFLITLMATLFLAYLSIPPLNSRLITVALGDYRGVYNSAWVAATLSLMCSTFLSLIGFYLVKNSIDRDVKTGVGQMLAATPVSKFTYLAGKALSNFALFSTIVLVIMFMSPIMQLIRGEDTAIQIWPTVAPFLLMVLPFLAVVGACAVLFEATPILKGTWGNVIYYILWNVMLVLFLTASESGKLNPVHHDINDLPGMTAIIRDMTNAAHAKFPDYDGNIAIGGTIAATQGLTTFVWNGVNWTWSMAFGRLYWLLAALGMVVVAVLPFNRFDPSTAKARKSKKKLAPESALPEPIPAIESKSNSGNGVKHLLRFPIKNLILGELKLALSSAGKWWYFIAAGLLVASLFAPLDVSRRWLLPVIWIWPLAIWSSMGCRENLHGTGQLVFAGASIGRRQMPALLLAGMSVALLTGLGLGIRFLIAGELGSLFSWFAGAVTISSLAVALGVLTGGKKVFELTYMMLWYVGPMNAVPQLDFMGATPEASGMGIPIYCILVSALLFTLAWIKRRRQVMA